MLAAGKASHSSSPSSHVLQTARDDEEGEDDNEEEGDDLDDEEEGAGDEEEGDGDDEEEEGNDDTEEEDGNDDEEGEDDEEEADRTRKERIALEIKALIKQFPARRYEDEMYELLARMDHNETEKERLEDFWKRFKERHKKIIAFVTNMTHGTGCGDWINWRGRLGEEGNYVLHTVRFMSCFFIIVHIGATCLMYDVTNVLVIAFEFRFLRFGPPRFIPRVANTGFDMV